MDSGAAIKKKGVKTATCNDEEHKRRRENKAIALRKEKREEGIEKKRKGALEAPAAAATGVPAIEVSVANLQEYCACAKSDVAEMQLAGVTAIRKLLSKESHPPVKEVLKTGILPRLLELIVSQDCTLGVEAAWAVTNVASTEYTSAVVDAGGVRPLVAGMMSGDAAVRDQCVWGLGNIAGDCGEYRNLLLHTEGALQALFLNIQNPANIQILRNSTWALSNFCRGKPSPAPDMVAAMLPALAFLLSNEDRDTVMDAAWGVSYLSDGDEVTVQAVVNAGLLTRCIALMGSGDANLSTPAVRVVGNVIAGTDVQTQAALDAGALAAITPLLSHSKKNIRRESCWALSNVAAGTHAQITTMVGTPGLVAGVIVQLRDGEFHVRREAAWVVSNIVTTGNASHVAVLIDLGVAEPLSSLVTCADPRLQCVILDAIKCMLVAGAGPSNSPAEANPYKDAFEEAGLLDKLEDVQTTRCHTDVTDRAVEIITRFYGQDEDEEEEGQAGAHSALIALGAKASDPFSTIPGPGAFVFGSSASTNVGFNGFGAGFAPAAAMPSPAAPAFSSFATMQFM